MCMIQALTMSDIYFHPKIICSYIHRPLLRALDCKV